MTLPRLAMTAAFCVPLTLIGCGGNEANTPEAKIAEQAVGIKPGGDPSRTVKEKHDVEVKVETTVKDKATGQILSDTVKTTPVTIIQEKSDKTDVKVDVGDSKSSGTEIKTPATDKK